MGASSALPHARLYRITNGFPIGSLDRFIQIVLNLTRLVEFRRERWLAT